MNNLEEVAIKLCQELERKGAEAISLLAIGEVSGYADYLVVATVSNRTLTKSLADYLQRYLKSAGIDVIGYEGEDTPEWVLVDTGDIVIHLFLPEARSYYDIEALWLDAPRIKVLSVADKPHAK